ncbi:hypothetical protein AWN76_005225 [Rhodothermaceae bacterium RA]|nr:hypothetical protein AWN76_005225 [Rhodothermaceae bacterium RA]
MASPRPTQADVRAAVVEVASRWQDPDHPRRADAVAATLAAPNRFTAEAVAFAVNQQMSLLTPEALTAWASGTWAAAPLTVGVLNAGNVPLAGLQDALAVLLAGHHYLGTVSSKSPALLPAFLAEVREHLPVLPVRFVEAATLFAEAEAVIATGSDETADRVAAQCEAHGIPPARRLLRGHRFGVAVIDGQESDDEREMLAEDALLHEGYGCRNVALIWAPAGLAPDPYLDAFAAFRSVFPVHPDLPGALRMQQAFLEATGQPHAYGEGLEFLLSRGAPEPQRPGHIRWVEYEDLDEVNRWLHEHAGRIQIVVARDGLRARLAAGDRLEPLGMAQRPALDWRPDGVDTMAFLAQLSRDKDEAAG